jgi:hypothetical protein
MRKPLRKRILGRAGSRWEDNIKTDLRETGSENEKRMELRIVVSPSSNPQTGGPSLIGCPRLSLHICRPSLPSAARGRSIAIFVFASPDTSHYIRKVKVKLPLCLAKCRAVRTYWGSVGVVPRIPGLGTGWSEW